VGKYSYRFTSARRGFITLWALFFMAGVTLLLALILTGQTARHRTAQRTIHQYQRAGDWYAQRLRERARTLPR